MRKTLFLFSCLAVQLAASVPVLAANGNTGTTGAQILEIVPDARGAAMGGAFTGIADDASSIYHNPAGLGTIYHTEASFFSTKWFEGMNFQSIGFVYSLRDVRTLNVWDMGTLALSLTSFRSGNLTGRDINGAPTGNFSARDEYITLSYGKAVAGNAETGKVMLGLNTKFVTEELKGRKTDSLAFDAGALWQTASRGLSFGAALQNIGSHPDGRFPLNYKAGVSYKTPDGRFLLASDINRPEYSDVWFSAGAEHFVANALALRAGYTSQDNQGCGFTTGVGLVFREVDIMFMYAREIEISYAFVPYGDLGDTHRLAFLVKLGVE